MINLLWKGHFGQIPLSNSLNMSDYFASFDREI